MPIPSFYTLIAAIFVVARSSVSESEYHYISQRFFCIIFSVTRFFDVAEPTFLELCHMAWLWLQWKLCYTASPKVPPKIEEGQKPQISTIFGQTAIRLAPPFLNGDENRKSTRDDTNSVWIGPQTTKIDALVYMCTGSEDFATFGKYGVYLENGTI